MGNGGRGPRLRGARLQARALIRYRLPESFYLYAGNLSRNKNLALLVRTYATEVGGRDIFLPVVIVGSEGQKLKALVRRTGGTAEGGMQHAMLRG